MRTADADVRMRIPHADQRTIELVRRTGPADKYEPGLTWKPTTGGTGRDHTRLLRERTSKCNRAR